MKSILKTTREDMGLTQQQLAEKSGVSYSGITKFESGDRALEGATLENAIKIANALGVEDLREMINEPKAFDGRYSISRIGNVIYFKTPPNGRFRERVREIGAHLVSPVKNIHCIESDKMYQVRQIMREEYGRDDSEGWPEKSVRVRFKKSYKSDKPVVMFGKEIYRPFLSDVIKSFDVTDSMNAGEYEVSCKDGELEIPEGCEFVVHRVPDAFDYVPNDLKDYCDVVK